MGRLSTWKTTGAVLMLCGATAIVASAQTYQSRQFDWTNGAGPQAALMQGSDGNFYGATDGGGDYQFGTVFKVSPAGKLTTLHSFCAQQILDSCTDGESPDSQMVQTHGRLYGTTPNGGAINGCGFTSCGTVFTITTDGAFATLYTFCSLPNCADGSNPYGLIEGANENLYGITSGGGTNQEGTIFEITSDGELTTIYIFCSLSNCADGSYPTSLMLAADGNFYGTTWRGGTYDSGTFFRVTSAGVLTTLYSFCSRSGCADGALPVPPLIQGVDGDFYGMTFGGGSDNWGTVFQLTSSGMLTTLHTFCSEENCEDGVQPYAGFVQGTDGNLYGTTYSGGRSSNRHCGNGCGTAFVISPTTGSLTTLYDFCSQTKCRDGASPAVALIQATNGAFYGAAVSGGNFGQDQSCAPESGCGTLFSLSVGLGPFVEMNPGFGKDGRDIGIQGNDLTGTTAVTFNGTLATFTVQSSTFVKATVPAGATTGYVTVTTPSGTLTSNVPFHVIK
jgi:uncharacterized repeat protein (TIGR03803 family)